MGIGLLTRRTELSTSVRADCDGKMDGDLNQTRLVLVGRAGSGKSSTGNSILGKDVFPVGNYFGRAGQTVMEDCRKTTSEIQVIDTPGFFDTEVNEAEIALCIVRALKTAPHAVLLVVKFGRFSEEDGATFRLLKALFADSEMANYTIVIFTGGDSLENGKTSIRDYIRRAPESLKKVLGECEQRYAVFNNHADDKRPQVQELLNKVQSLTESHLGEPFKPSLLQEFASSSLDDSKMKEEVERRLRSFHQSELKAEESQHQPQKYVRHGASREGPGTHLSTEEERLG